MRTLIILLGFLISINTTFAQPTVQVGATTLTERVVAAGLSIPWDIAWGPDDHIWLSERYGYVKRVNPQTGNVETSIIVCEDCFVVLPLFVGVTF